MSWRMRYSYTERKKQALEAKINVERTIKKNQDVARRMGSACKEMCMHARSECKYSSVPESFIIQVVFSIICILIAVGR
jgi:hypothetical protein